jgi:hypothetical protein
MELEGQKPFTGQEKKVGAGSSEPAEQTHHGWIKSMHSWSEFMSGHQRALMLCISVLRNDICLYIVSLKCGFSCILRGNVFTIGQLKEFPNLQCCFFLNPCFI